MSDPEQIKREIEGSLSGRQKQEVEQRAAIGAVVVHEAIRKEGEEELSRPSSAPAWSGLAAGLSMGFSLVAQGLLRARLPEAPWAPLVYHFGYTVLRLWVVVLLANLAGVWLSHIIAGSADTFYLVVAVLNHAQVVAGKIRQRKKRPR